MKKVLCFALALAMLISSVPAFAAEQKVVTVSNMQDMVSAIKSNTKIIIEEGSYIANAGAIKTEYGYIKTGIRIENIENLTIEAKGNVEIKLNVGYLPVFELENSENISFIGLSLGHDVPESDCIGDGDVIYVSESNNIKIDNCDLWGCGITGIVSFSSGDINVTNTTIRDCAVAAARVDYSKGDVVFDNCKILRNTYYDKDDPSDWSACFKWYQNKEDAAVGKFVVKNSLIEGNYSGNFYDDGGLANKFEFINCTVKNNAWDKAAEDVTQQPQQEYVEPEYEEPVEDYPYEEGFVTLEYYDESVISISGITGYDESRVVMGDNIVAMCSSPVVIEAKTDLDHMGIVKLDKKNGEWVEARYFEGYAVNYGDTSKNWFPAEGFENVDVDYYEFTGTEADLNSVNTTVKNGKKLSLSEKGMYLVWANGANGGSTGLTFEIGDTIAAYTDSKVLVDGKQVKFEAYNINDNNYFKLRDIAYALTNYGKGFNVFNVKWDEAKNMINLVSGEKYDTVGGELREGDGKNKNYKLSSSAIMKDGRNVALNAYNINDNNYFKLRDLGKLFDFNVAWDEANNCILIDTTSSYME